MKFRTELIIACKMYFRVVSVTAAFICRVNGHCWAKWNGI